MPVVRTAVLLFAYPAGEKLSLRGAPWYVGYFFSPSYGLAAYWNKQTNNGLILDGEVFDWAVIDDPNPDLTSRKSVIESAIASMENDRGANFNNFDIIITVIAAPKKVNSDGGSTTVNSKHRSHAGVAMRVGDRFDFVAHEIGHGLGLDHSYGSPLFKSDTWSQYGEYGHPYCIMSAMSYGGIGGPYFPAVPRDNAPEFTALGPGLNASTALGRGWLWAHNFNIAPGSSAEFEIASRHWGASIPQAVQMNAADGKTYTVEFREDDGWDKGQGKPLLIINQGKGSTGDLAHPGTFGATYLGKIEIPITFGATGSVFNGPGFGIQVLERNTAAHSISIRINSWHISNPELEISDRLSTLRTEIVDSGLTDFGQGEVLCIDGKWAYTKYAKWQEAVFETAYNGVRPPINVAWTVADQPLAGMNGTLLLYIEVQVAQPKLNSVGKMRFVSVDYVIEPLANGSRLKLHNHPADETFSLDIVANATSSVGSGTQSSSVEFKGMEYEYPAELYEMRQRCIDNLINIGKRYVRYKVLLPPDLWKDIPDERHEEVEGYLNALAHYRAEENHTSYKQILTQLENVIGKTNIGLHTVSTEEKAHIVPQVGAQEPQMHMGNKNR